MKYRAVIGALALVLAFCGSWVTAQAFECNIGDKGQVLWKNQWYPATVTDVNESHTNCYIHYDGYGNDWDEWVGQSRIKLDPKGVFKNGDNVEVLWKETWYPATVLKVEAGRFYIHYTGYGSNWDEWVGPNRIR